MLSPLTKDGQALEGLFDVHGSVIPGCLELRPHGQADDRGRFVKVFHRDAFASLGLCTAYAEDFYSVSRYGVVRGLHFQVPPMEQVKLVYCVSGRIQDVVLDLRAGSPTYGRHVLIEISSAVGNMVYVPAGVAHGFCTLSETATVVYKVSREYSRAHDGGVLWNSIDIPWAVQDPVLSERDRTHPRFESFQSPFRYEAAV